MKSKTYKDDIDFNYALSLSDLMFVDGWKMSDIESVERILYENGIDVKLGWCTDKLLHRNLQNKVVDTLRFCGTQRTDKEWLPYMSTEDRIANTTDAYLKAELMVMSKRSNFSGDLIDKYGEEGDEV
jgi:hypothetical protein